jgi:hypothetical protein
MMSPADHIAQLEYALREQMTVIDELRATVDQRNAEIAELVAWIATDADALGTLRSVYVDPRTSVPNKVKAAASALPFERTRPASVNIVVDFREQVKAARLHTIEQRRLEWGRAESQPQLGSDHGGDALGPEPAA